MSEENGNGQQALQIDVTDDHAFRTAVVQHLQLLADRTACLPSLKKKVDRHELYIAIGKWTALPFLAAFHTALKHALSKIGW